MKAQNTTNQKAPVFRSTSPPIEPQGKNTIHQQNIQPVNGSDQPQQGEGQFPPGKPQFDPKMVQNEPLAGAQNLNPLWIVNQLQPQ